MALHFLTLFFLMVFLHAEIFAQMLPSIQTDRPDQTECPFIVPKNHFQMENGFSMEQTDDETVTLFYPSSLLKYGLSKAFELRLIMEMTNIRMDDWDVNGLNPVTAGFKVNLAQEKGILPVTSFIGHITFPGIASEAFRSTLVAPSFRFTFQHSMTEKINLGYNLGAEWDGESPEATYLYTITASYSVFEKTGCYIELYGFASHSSKPDHRLDGGFNYLLKENISIDLSGGAGITDISPMYYAALGLSFRLKD